LTTYNRLVVCWWSDREQRGPGRRLFHALSDRTRRDILRRVLAGEHSVTALAASYDMSFAAVQKHVAVLEKAGLLNKRRSGREQLASGDVDAVRSVASMLDELESVWRGGSPASTHYSPRRDDMPVTDITKDVERRTFAITAEFAAPVERVWALYADPRQLEQVWGPPEYPATFVDHDLRPAGG
jgi:DNA-binding transcriptional ArsR family regulator